MVARIPGRPFLGYLHSALDPNHPGTRGDHRCLAYGLPRASTQRREPLCQVQVRPYGSCAGRGVSGVRGVSGYAMSGVWMQLAGSEQGETRGVELIEHEEDEMRVRPRSRRFRLHGGGARRAFERPEGFPPLLALHRSYYPRPQTTTRCAPINTVNIASLDEARPRRQTSPRDTLTA